MLYRKHYQFLCLCSLDDSSDASEEIPAEEVEDSDEDELMEEPPSKRRGVAKLTVHS